VTSWISNCSGRQIFQDAPGGYVNFCLNTSFGNRPWLLDNFDQIEFYEITEDEYDKIYARFKAGQFKFDIQPATFDVEEYRRFCASVAEETELFKAKQAEATEKEMKR
jgi:urea carboxylase